MPLGCHEFIHDERDTYHPSHRRHRGSVHGDKRDDVGNPADDEPYRHVHCD